MLLELQSTQNDESNLITMSNDDKENFGHISSGYRSISFAKVLVGLPIECRVTPFGVFNNKLVYKQKSEKLIPVASSRKKSDLNSRHCLSLALYLLQNRTANLSP